MPPQQDQPGGEDRIEEQILPGYLHQENYATGGRYGIIGLFITGQSINLMTLGGMSLAVGILVDMGTVVIENIHTQMAKQPSLARAVFVGTSETTIPIFAPASRGGRNSRQITAYIGTMPP